MLKTCYTFKKLDSDLLQPITQQTVTMDSKVLPKICMHTSGPPSVLQSLQSLCTLGHYYFLCCIIWQNDLCLMQNELDLIPGTSSALQWRPSDCSPLEHRSLLNLVLFMLASLLRTTSARNAARVPQSFSSCFRKALGPFCFWPGLGVPLNHWLALYKCLIRIGLSLQWSLWSLHHFSSKPLLDTNESTIKSWRSADLYLMALHLYLAWMVTEASNRLCSVILYSEY